MSLLGKEIGHFGNAPITVGGLLMVAVGLLLALVAAEGAARAVRRVLRRRGFVDGSSFAVARLVRYAVGTVAVLVSVNSAGVDLGAVLAASTVFLVGIGLGLQRIAQDFVAGIVLLLERPVLKGDFIRVGELRGVVDYIGARTTRIVTRDRVSLIVPNSELTNAVVLNFTRPADLYRLWVTFGVAYGTDVDRLRAVCQEVALLEPAVVKDPPPQLLLQEFGDSALKYGLAVFVSDPQEELQVASRLRFALMAEFAKADILFPFPQLDVHVRQAGT